MLLCESINIALKKKRQRKALSYIFSKHLRTNRKNPNKIEFVLKTSLKKKHMCIPPNVKECADSGSQTKEGGLGIIVSIP